MANTFFRIAEIVSRANTFPPTAACTATSYSCLGNASFNRRHISRPRRVALSLCTNVANASTAWPLTNTSSRTTSEGSHPASS